jgi:hypothetical protein
MNPDAGSFENGQYKSRPGFRPELAERRVFLGRDRCEREGCTGKINTTCVDERGERLGVCSKCGAALRKAGFKVGTVPKVSREVQQAAMRQCGLRW